MRAVVAFGSGAVVAVVTWLLLMPWDLSEVTPDGRLIEGGGDDYGTQLVLVAATVVALGLVGVVWDETRALAASFVAGGLVAWTVLFAWRAGVAETEGANLFMAPLVVLFGPATVVTPMLVRAIGRRLDRPRARQTT